MDASQSDENTSTTTEFHAEELLENASNVNSPKPLSADERISARRRNLLKRLNLADTEKPILTKSNDYVDDTKQQEEKKSLEWLKDRFPSINMEPKKSAALAPGRGATMKDTRMELATSLSDRRKKDQTRRKELFMNDNEELFIAQRECEEEEDEDDEEYVEDECEEVEDQGESAEETVPPGAPCSPTRAADDDDQNNTTPKPESTDLQSRSRRMTELQGVVNPDDTRSPEFPNSYSQWYEESESSSVNQDGSHDNKKFENMMDEFGVKNNGNETSILNLCSGEFQTQGTQKHRPSKVVVYKEDRDTPGPLPVNNLLNPRTAIPTEDFVHDSDTKDLRNEMNEDKPTSPVSMIRPIRRAFIDDDDEEKSEDDEEDHSDEEEADAEEESDVEEEPPAASTVQKNDVDSDDELAIYRAMRQTASRFVDEEAELSGDDVGSDDDREEDGPDDYEAEAGDLDDVPEEEELRRDLHKQLMKDESARDHKDLMLLREKFLAEGDLTGVETNRSFRLKLRQDDHEEIDEEAETIEDNEEDVPINIESVKLRLLGGEEEQEEAPDSFEDALIGMVVATAPSVQRVRPSLLSTVPTGTARRETMSEKEPSAKNAFFVNIASTDQEVNTSSKRKLPFPNFNETKKCRTSSSDSFLSSLEKK